MARSMTYHGIDIPEEAIADFCRRHRIVRFDLFGSILRDDFRPESDIDVLVEFEAEHSVGLLQMADIELELSQLLGRKVDLVERKAVESSENYIRRRHVLQSAEPLYVAR